MKNILILVFFFPIVTFSQAWFEVYPYTTIYDFENTLNYQYLTFDTIPNQTNIWQIAKPNKLVLDTTIYANQTNFNVIITDSLNPYPTNDTSSFTIKIPLPTMGTDFFLSGNYFVDTDSLNDYAKIEYSMDNGLNWVLISDDTLVYENLNNPSDSLWPNFYNQGLVLTGSSNGWKYFQIDLIKSYQLFNHNTDQEWIDTAKYRFTFISDNVFDNKDGIMFDDITIVNVFAFSIDENERKSIKIFPNPLISNVVNFELQGISLVEIYDLNGKLFFTYQGKNISKLDIPNLPKGIYLLKAKTENGNAFSNKIIIQ